jgi:DNA damage-inducible protein 1
MIEEHVTLCKPHLSSSPQAAAERCGIMRLVDRRWAGIAKGVGVQKIIGRVHMAQIQISDDYLTSSFSILEDQPMVGFYC